VRTATRHCLPIHLKRVSAATSAHFARRASSTYWKTSVQTAAVALLQGQSGRRTTGKATTASARILQVPGSGTDRLIRTFIPASQPQSRTYRHTEGRHEDGSSRCDSFTAQAATTPSATNVSIAAASYPYSPSTSRVCSPSIGAGRVTCVGVAEK